MKPPEQITLKVYLTLSQKMMIEGSFFHSLPYLEYARAEAYINDHWAWVKSDEWIMFTPIRISDTPRDASAHFPKGDIWCMGNDDWNMNQKIWTRQFLDYEYIFDPGDFQDMNGGHWNTFRKNVRKWPRDNGPGRYTNELVSFDDLSHLMGEWLEGRSDKAEDAELMVNMVLNVRPDVKKCFMYQNRTRSHKGNWELVGVNVWDINNSRINYRLCIAKPGERFLDEYLRYRFYMDPEIIKIGLQVNDGGTLGREGLERFKDKMNPMMKIKRYSLIKANKE